MVASSVTGGAYAIAGLVDAMAVPGDGTSLSQPMHRPSAPGPTTRAFVSWTLRYGWLLWCAAVLLAIPATARTVSLYRHLRSDLEELLPRESPSVRALDE